MSDYKNKRCGDCYHWCPLAEGATADANGVPIVGQERRGHCREGPVSVTLIPVANAPGRVAPFTGYPLPTENEAACSHFKERETAVKAANIDSKFQEFIPPGVSQ